MSRWQRRRKGELHRLEGFQLMILICWCEQLKLAVIVALVKTARLRLYGSRIEVFVVMDNCHTAALVSNLGGNSTVCFVMSGHAGYAARLFTFSPWRILTTHCMP